MAEPLEFTAYTGDERGTALRGTHSIMLAPASNRSNTRRGSRNPLAYGSQTLLIATLPPLYRKSRPAEENALAATDREMIYVQEVC